MDQQFTHYHYLLQLRTTTLESYPTSELPLMMSSGVEQQSGQQQLIKSVDIRLYPTDSYIQPIDVANTEITRGTSLYVKVNK